MFDKKYKEIFKVVESLERRVTAFQLGALKSVDDIDEAIKKFDAYADELDKHFKKRGEEFEEYKKAELARINESVRHHREIEDGIKVIARLMDRLPPVSESKEEVER